MAAKTAKKAASKPPDTPGASTCRVDGCDREAAYVPGVCRAHYDTHRGLARKPESKG